MANVQIGNALGVAATGPQPNEGTKLADISAEGVNTFTTTVGELRNLRVGQNIDFRTKTTGALVANRNITIINVSGVVTYDGADAATTVAEGVYTAGGYSPVDTAAPFYKVNLNGGPAADRGYDHAFAHTLADMRARLTAKNGAYYTSARLDGMSWNDLVYALRLEDAPLSVG